MPTETEKIIRRWRDEANDLARINREGRYPDQLTRVRNHMILITLRRCADSLQRQTTRKPSRAD